MISNKELNYVSSFARYAPFPGSDYAYKVMNDIIKAHNQFISEYKDKSHYLIFSNGDEIEFTILEKNLAHLLGVDLKNISSEPMTETRCNILGYAPNEIVSSYDLLNRIIDRADEVLKNDMNPRNYKLLNYYKILIKCAIFFKITNFSNFNFGCINFDVEKFRAFTNRQEFSVNSTKYLFTPSNEALIPYFMMGIVYDTYEQKYVPESLMGPTSFVEYIANQELVIPTQILTEDSTTATFTKKEASNSEKLSIYNMYKTLLLTYSTNTSINIFNDYENMLKSEEPKKLERC